PAGCGLSSASVAVRITALNHESCDHTVKNRSVIVSALRKKPKVFGRLGRFIIEQFKLNRSEIGLDYDVSTRSTLSAATTGHHHRQYDDTQRYQLRCPGALDAD